MFDIPELEALRKGRFFEGWDGFVEAERVKAAEDSLKRLVDDLLAAGPDVGEEAARGLIHQCVQRFNEMNGHWICTIEREDICEQVLAVVDLCGFQGDDDWLSEREW